MPTYKRIDGDYTITTVNPADVVTIDAHTTQVVGNLNVVGNLTYIDVTDLRVEDPFITVAANNSGSGNTALFTSQGLVAQTGTGTYAGIRFNNFSSTWQISPNVDFRGDPITAYTPISTTTTLPGGPLNSLQYKAGNATFNGDSALLFDAANSQITLQGHMVFGNIGAAPTATANSVAIYNDQTGSGGTGLFVKSSTVEDELVSRNRAVVFGLIF